MMAPNVGAILLVILSSWTQSLPSLKASPSHLVYDKANMIVSTSRCCRVDTPRKTKFCMPCRRVVETERGSRVDSNHCDGRLLQLGHFKALELILKLRSLVRPRENKSFKLAPRFDKTFKNYSRHKNINTSSYRPRDSALDLIFQRISRRFLGTFYDNSTLSLFSPFSQQENYVTHKNITSDKDFLDRSKELVRGLSKRNWNRSYPKSVFVFGKDDRTQISSYLIRKFPYSNIVRLSTGCTGTLVTPLHVLTAAHCVHNGREFLNKLEMMKVEIPDPIGLRVYYMEKIGIPDRWLNPRSRNYQQASFDYAVVRLSYGVHGRYQFLPLAVPTESTLHNNLQFLGFPNYGYGLWRSVCPARTTKSFMDGNLILARCDSAIGNSGAAIFTADFRAKKRVVGVLSSTVSMGDNPLYQRYSVITAFTETKLLDICTEIGPVGVFYGVCPSPEAIAVRRQGFQRKIKTIPFFG